MVKVYAGDMLIRETDDERCVAAVMSFIANPLPSSKHSEPGINELLQLAVDTGLKPGEVYTTQNREEK